MTTATAQQQQQHPLQTAMKKTKIPHQFIPLICVLVIAKIPTCLLAGFVLGYFILFRQQDDSPRETRLIEAPPANPPFVAQNSLEYDNEPHYASINHPTLDDQQEQDDISNASSIDFENLMKFPSCPTTLPRLDTHFNFVSDDENHHHLQESSTIDWSAIHQELEYDKQRNSKPKIKKEQHPLDTSQSQNDMLTFSSSSSTSEEDEEVSSLLSLETTTKPSSAKQTTNPVMTPLPHDNNAAAAILLVDQPDHSERAMSPLAPPTATTTIDNMTLLDDILLLPPSPMLLPRPSLSSPGQLFKMAKVAWRAEDQVRRARTVTLLPAWPPKQARCSFSLFSLTRVRPDRLHPLA
ncbi:hypothetical protein [Parasitella parasitica]|uniref:Uncharacterized protein n=1 Tax=Parasitella parasitica TaxID=35722 RepID=A0A0B7NDS9_9FUNG|nr:hypothetical protein [Parasitella parasitica]